MWVGGGGRDIPKERAVDPVAGCSIFNDAPSATISSSRRNGRSARILTILVPSVPFVSADTVPWGGAPIRAISSCATRSALHNETTVSDGDGTRRRRR
jgi:hypothetical protein